MATVKSEPSAPRVLELLAPRFAEFSEVAGSLPVSLDLSASMDVQLVFWERGGVAKELECVDVDDGCPRCKFESFLRGLVIEGLHEVAAVSKLEEFDFVKCHLVVGTDGAGNESEEGKVEAARRSRCHVVGCRLHRWKAPRTQVTPDRTTRPAPARRRPSAKVPVERQIQVPAPASPPAVDVSSPTPSVLESNTVLLKEERPVLSEPPSSRKLSLPDVFHALMTRIEAAPTDLWSEDVAGLDLRLYEHQRRGLSWMMKRERGLLWDTLLLHPFSVPGKQSDTDRELETEFAETAYDACGGMLCDEPGPSRC
ncbi:hypothetical protein PHYPSEUDO_003429 [Phytophthora pseudosyringae]|uniref:Uncharacterized protein n=1 Tax=Phytophthora pseudosyringae TaxID=221518 RepID=A0A8T1WJC2_9STRA|nr:hypothetical protein PHYPSEUDO_003429 [Phytophthora pseudosyringae]